MEVHDKIKVLRQSKDLTQEELAEKLGISATQYGAIERGKTKDLKVSRLKKIAEHLGVELSELFSLNEKGVVNLACELTHQNNNNWHLDSQANECLELKHELEKYQLIIEQKDKEITYLKEILLLKEQLLREKTL